MKTNIPSLIGIILLGLLAGGCAVRPSAQTIKPSSGVALSSQPCSEQPGDEWAPYFKDQPDDLTLKVGASSGARLKAVAKVSSKATVEYQWYKGVDPLPVQGDTLSLRPVTLDTAGFYVCQASTRVDGVVHETCSRLAEVQVYVNGSRTAGLASLRSTNMTIVSTVTVSAPPRMGLGSVGSGCPGAYVARAGFRDASGNLTWTPPAGATRFVISDVTANKPPGYASSVAAAVGLTQVACGSGSASYSLLSASQRFSFTIYVNTLGTPPPANWTGPIRLQVDWY